MLSIILYPPPSKQRATLLSCVQSQNTINSSLGKVEETSARSATAPAPGSSSPPRRIRTRSSSLWLALKKQCRRPRRSWRSSSRVWWGSERLEREQGRKSLVSLTNAWTSNVFLYPLQENVIEGTMSVDPKHHRYFVARRGQVLRDLADEYGGVMVSFPRTGSQSEKVTLKGAKECVEAAKKRMQEIIEDLVSRRAVLQSKSWCACVFCLYSNVTRLSFEHCPF